MTSEELIQAIEKMTVLELSDLVKALEERFGVSAAAPMAMAMAAPAAAEEVAEEEEQIEFDLVLKEVGDKKIQVIKAVREMTTLGLREAKEVVDGAPSTVLKGVPKDEAEAGLKKLQEAGAAGEVK